jgi:serine/threonine protein kinase
MTGAPRGYLMREGWTPVESWVSDQMQRFVRRRPSARPAVFSDTTNFMAIDRDAVIELHGDLYLVTCTEQERRFGLEGEPKFWVKRALDLDTGRAYILKLVFNEVFIVHLGTSEFRCMRSPEKESRVLDVARGDGRFMQGRTVRDTRGNCVRLIEFIHGIDLLSRLSSLSVPHEEYFYTQFPALLGSILGSFAAIRMLHDAGLCHGDIRNDHILIDHASARLRWIDFDLETDREYDVWALGNVLHCLVAKGFVTFREVLRDRPDLAGRLSTDDASVFMPNRVMNLRKVYPYLPAKLNDVLMRFAEGAPAARYEAVHQLIDDVGDCLGDLEANVADGSMAAASA